MQLKNDNTPPHESGSDFILDEGEEEEELFEVDENELEQYLEGNDEVMEEDEEEENEEDATDVESIVLSIHKGSVFCCELSPSAEIGATGGEDDKAYVFDATTGAAIFECKGHRDSVTNLSFSHDGTYVATGDMSGYLQVWKVSTQSRIWEFETNDLNWIQWHNSSNILFAGTSEGDIWMWLIPKGNTKLLSNSGVSSECAALTRDGKRLCAGFKDGSVRIIDLKKSETIHNLDKFHELQVTSISVHQDKLLVLSGSEDGNAKLLNANSGREITTFNCELSNNVGEDCSAEEYNHSVEVVSFCPTNADLAVTATLSGMITIWNISSQTSRHHIIQGCGTSSISWHPSEPYFISSGLDGKLRVYDVRSAEQIFKFKGDGSGILCCHMKKDGSKIITSSDKGTVKILNVGHLWAR